MRRPAHWRDVTRLAMRMALTALVAGAAFLVPAEGQTLFRAAARDSDSDAMVRMLPIHDPFVTDPVLKDLVQRIQAAE